MNLKCLIGYHAPAFGFIQFNQTQIKKCVRKLSRFSHFYYLIIRIVYNLKKKKNSKINPAVVEGHYAFNF